MACLHVALKVRAVYQALEVAAPAVLGVQGFPVRTQRGQDALIPDDFAITEEVQVHRATLEVDAVHGLAAARFHINGLLLWSTGKLPACDHEALVGSILNQLAHIQQECGLFLTKTHGYPFFEQLGQCTLRLLSHPYRCSPAFFPERLSCIAAYQCSG